MKPRLRFPVFLMGLFLGTVLPGWGVPEPAPTRLSILQTGAVADGTTLNTTAIQAAIEQLAASGGGTLVVPPGIFLTGALDLRPGVHLHLERDAVLRCTTDMTAFPSRPTRIEGQHLTFTPALLNADGCDGLRITGEGTLDGAGRPIWDEFWTRRRAAPDPRNFPNLSVLRARLAHIRNSRDVRIEGVTFADSQFWNLHLYNCREVVVKGAHFRVPDDYEQAPSTDGIDVDSCQDVLIEGCTFSVTDDCIVMKGTKGPQALDDTLSPPVERVRIAGCIFRRGHSALTLGSEATVVRDIVLENSSVLGAMFLLHVKLRPDTPQHYERVAVRDITLASEGGRLIHMRPWRQYFDLQGAQSPTSVVRGITFSRLRGQYGAFGEAAGINGQSQVEGLRFEEVNLQLGEPTPRLGEGVRLELDDVRINGERVSEAAI